MSKPQSSSGDARDQRTLPIVDPRRYLLGRELARGGQGLIREAHDQRLGRTVAIKELIVDGRLADARFVREIRLTARLQHPAIASVYEAGRWPRSERPFYTMRKVNGVRLDQVLAEPGDLGQRLARLPALISVVEAVAYAHSQRIVHRDLEPSNVILGRFGEVVVLDWGLAKDLDLPEEEDRVDPLGSGSHGVPTPLTMAGSVIGTPAYMAPEQAGGEVVDSRADVFSLGALLYHLLAGLPPYQANNPLKVIFAVLNGPPTPLAERQPALPEDLLALVDKAMAWKAAERYPSALELAEDLERFGAEQLLVSQRATWRQLARGWVDRLLSRQGHSSLQA